MPSVVFPPCRPANSAYTTTPAAVPGKLAPTWPMNVGWTTLVLLSPLMPESDAGASWMKLKIGAASVTGIICRNVPPATPLPVGKLMPLYSPSSALPTTSVTPVDRSWPAAL